MPCHAIFAWFATEWHPTENQPIEGRSRMSTGEYPLCEATAQLVEEVHAEGVDV
jgi:hypothetical protein